VDIICSKQWCFKVPHFATQGSGVAITKYVRNMTWAWVFCLELTNRDLEYLNNINLAAGKIPPYYKVI
jgi:hypothetical protein